MTTYTPYTYKGKTMLIERYVLLGEQECAKEDYNLFDLNISPFALEKLAQAERDGYAEFPLFEDKNRELFNTFRYYPHPENKKIFLATEVHSYTKTKVLLCLICSSCGKIWLNGKCLTSFHGVCPDTYYLSGILNKGENTILAEIYSPNDMARLNIQLMNHRFEQSGDFKALANMKEFTNIDPLMMVNDPFYVPAAKSFRFMYMLNDETKYKPEYRVDIHDSNTGLVKSIPAKISEPVEIDVSELRGLHEETLRHDWLGCVFNEPDGKEFVAGPCIITRDFHERTDEIAAECAALVKDQPAEIGSRVLGILERLEDCRRKKDDNSAYWISYHLKDLMGYIKAGSCRYETYKIPGVQEFYISSNLDDSHIRMLARIPAGYTGQQAYPVILALATGNDGGFCWMASVANILNDFLIFDVSGRGFTGGSYVGESSTMEIMEWIFANYVVDRDRVYVLGISNGGFATWALAQNYPHIPAAIYPMIGYPAIETIGNVAGIPAYQAVSPKDHVFIGRTSEVKNRLKPYGNYTQYDFQEMMHHHVGNYIAHPEILKTLTGHRRKLWPEHIIYRTLRNRHLESFWVKLHGIARGKYAEADARIDSPERISVRLKNTDGITLTLPPRIERKDFEVVVNGCALSFADYKKPAVILRKEKGAWREVDGEPAVDYRKGTGLLDIYLDSLRIIVPGYSSDTLTQIANNFAKPFTNGADPKVYTNYPVYDPSTVPDRIFGHNLLLLETADCSNPYIRRFADKLPVQCDKTGYSRNNTRTDGGYVVMQVIPNPYDPRRTFLIISTNEEGLLRKHMLLRKVIIPTYINGIHPLWNNEVLVFDGKQYLAAYEHGDALSQVKNLNGGDRCEKQSA